MDYFQAAQMAGMTAAAVGEATAGCGLVVAAAYVCRRKAGAAAVQAAAEAAAVGLVAAAVQGLSTAHPRCTSIRFRRKSR